METVSALEVAKQYFDLSNRSDFEGIGKLMTENTTYSSQTTGVYLGRSDIITMQKAFHGMFGRLNWTVNSVEETKPGIVLFDYDFQGQASELLLPIATDPFKSSA